MPTSFPMSLPHAPTGFVNQAALDTAFTTPINDLYNLVGGNGYIGEANNTGTVTLNAIADFASLATVTFTLSTQTRVRIYASAGYSPTAASATARYRTRAGYNTGSSVVLGSFVQVGQPFDMPDTSANPGSAATEGTALLAAGTYIAYGIVRRSNGGAATDTATNFNVAVYGVGFA